MLNSEERSLKRLLQFWAILFLVAGIVFVFFPNLVVQSLNQLALKITPSLPTLPLSQDRFWVVLMFSLMITLTFLCYSAQDDLKRRKDLVQFVLISKITSSLFFLVFFFVDRMALAYLLGMLVDGSIFVITLIFYSRALKSSSLNL